MSINGHAKRTIQVLEGLGFEYVRFYEGKREYVHANAPDRPIRVPAGISEVAAKKLRNAASEIAGYSVAGERIPTHIRATARIKRQQAKLAEQARLEREAKAREPFERAAADRRARIDEEVRVNRADARRQEILDLMRPGRSA